MAKRTPLRHASQSARYVPADGMTPSQEIAHIERFMKQHRRAYDADPKLQERYRELLDVRETRQTLARMVTASEIDRNLGRA